MNYKITGASVFGTCRVTSNGRAYDDEFASTAPDAYTLFEKDIGVLVYALINHYDITPNCCIETDFGKISVYQAPVHNGCIVCCCDYKDGSYSYSPVFINTVSPLAVVNFFAKLHESFTLG